MIDEIVSAVATKTGITQDQAQSAADLVLSLLKSKLPEPLSGQLDSLLGSQQDDGDTQEQDTDQSGQSLTAKATGLLGSLFGSKT